MFEIDVRLNDPFQLESGEILDEIRLRCNIYGRLNADKSNAILVFHALTGSSRVGDWWNGIMCDGGALDTSEMAFVCVNYLGSCYGSTSARSLKQRGRELPIVTTRDIVRSNALLFDHLGIKKFCAVIGGSVGGMLALQFAVDLPDLADEIISIAATPLSAMGLALNHLQRQALGKNDLELARKIAVVSYKSPRQFGSRFGRRPNRNGENPKAKSGDRFDVGGYLDHHGDAFKKRFEIESYDLITKAMDLFELTDEGIRRVKVKVSLVGISSDWLFPAADVRALRDRLVGFGVNAKYHEIESDNGHDAFLSDIGEMSRVLREILEPENEETPFHFLANRNSAAQNSCNEKYEFTNHRTKTAVLPV
ncbi:MAG: alpha/beta fold hydrolase [Pyrinomonadaceae bacterium]